MIRNTHCDESIAQCTISSKQLTLTSMHCEVSTVKCSVQCAVYRDWSKVKSVERIDDLERMSVEGVETPHHTPCKVLSVQCSL